MSNRSTPNVYIMIINISTIIEIIHYVKNDSGVQKSWKLIIF